MNCIDYLRDMYAFLDGEVSVDRNLEILQHLNLCAGCARRSEGCTRITIWR